PGEPTVYRISTLEGDSADSPTAFSGLFDGDPFTHVAIITRDGRGYFVWYSFSLQTTEENLIFDLDAEGNFLLVGGEFGERYVVAEFRRMPSAPREDDRAGGVGTLPLPDDVDIETRIRAVESRSCLKIARNQENPWTPAEIVAMREVLTLLPPELRFQEPIIVVRADSTYVPGESSLDLVEISLAQRELRIRNFQTADTFGEPPESFHRAYLKRSLIHSLARFSYNDLPPDQKREWQSFALWGRGLFVPTYAENVNPAGYANKLGMNSPELDFATFAVEFFMPTNFKDPMNQVRYRLPDRYTFFSELFKPTELFASTPEAHATQAYVRSVRDWIDPDEVEHIELIVTTPTASAAESLAGHLLLLVKRKGDYHDGRDSLVLGFVGVTSLDTNNGVAGLTYAWRGLTGHYQSAIQEETFGGVVQRATVLENRDVQRFRLNLSEEETIRLVERLWVIQNTFSYQYRFFGVNCASMLFDALNHAFSDGAKITLAVPLVPPLYVVAALEQGGRLGGAIYPEYWSIGKTARHATAKNAKIQDEVLGFLRRRAHQSESLPMEVHDEVRSLFALLLSEGTAQVGTDQLWREPILEAGGTGRADAYTRLSSLFADIRSEHVGAGRALAPEEYNRLAELLLRFFMNAYDRELYIAVPTEIKDNYSDADPIAADISREFVQEQLQEIQLRNRNSKEIQSLRRALSSFRISLENTYPDASMYVIGREMQSETNAELAVARSDIARTHGYYPTEFSLGVQYRRTGSSFNVGFDAALFSEDLGHNSMFALKQDMRMVLLSVGVSARIGIDGGSLSWGQGLNSIGLRGTVFDFQKVLTGDDVDYLGFFSHGFGFTLLDGSVEVPDDTRQIADADIRLRALELRYVLNIFEVDEFRHFLNLSAGPSYLYGRTDGTGDHLFGLPLEAEGKFHTGGNLENSLRFCVRYEPLLSVGGALSHSLSGSIEFSWAPRNRPYSIRYAGAEMSLRLQSPDEGISSMYSDLVCYVRLR
ncbi:MAG: DUF4105 domain-containing protein, partial [Spirochaetales bacterium]|nr:DUF4105 domain-containing protein [Spirochaetales bacterium]